MQKDPGIVLSGAATIELKEKGLPASNSLYCNDINF